MNRAKRAYKLNYLSIKSTSHRNRYSFGSSVLLAT